MKRIKELASSTILQPISRVLLKDDTMEPRPKPPPVTYNSVTIYLFEATDLPAMNRWNGLSDPFCKFRLGGEKFRSRVIRKSLNPQWMEQFEVFLYEYDGKRLEISIWDWDRTMKNELIGRYGTQSVSTWSAHQGFSLTHSGEIPRACLGGGRS